VFGSLAAAIELFEISQNKLLLFQLVRRVVSVIPPNKIRARLFFLRPCVALIEVSSARLAHGKPGLAVVLAPAGHANAHAACSRLHAHVQRFRGGIQVQE
jgi:hypothetical protein